MDLLPLEKELQRVASQKEKFPEMSGSYFDLYVGLVQYLKKEIYPSIDSALATISKENGFYTTHNEGHFDEVIRYAGLLLGIDGKDGCDTKLDPYELYQLLVAIRIHDAGNIYGRDDHEKHCFRILRECTASGNDDAEKKIIANIAKAHGGETIVGSKDTINELAQQEHIGPLLIRPRLLASIVRFADEICENRSRAANHLLESGKLPKHSEIYHKYAASIKGNHVAAGRITLKYQITVQDALKKWEYKKNGKICDAYLVDVIYDRIEKMDRERKYCNRYSRDVYSVGSIRASIQVVDDQCDEIEVIPIPELNDAGYPEDDSSYVRLKLRDTTGEILHKRLIQENANEKYKEDKNV